MGAACLTLLTLASAPARAQTASVEAGLQEVTVTGNPLSAAERVSPAVSMGPQDLPWRARTTLGETLDGTPGVSSTYFGPNASRPVIRGLDGDRIRILNNSGATVDASSMSPDHAVPLDPLTVERIEVLRGPGALQYGGSAVGGVVNVIDNRIPREPLEGVVGKVDAGVATGNQERSGAALVEGGNDRFALHVDAFKRRTGDVRVPLALPCTKAGAPALAGRICNSASETEGGAVGGTAFWDRGYLGASVSTYRSNYGTVAEDAVTIGMRTDRYALEGEWRDPVAGVRSVKGQFSHTRYRHTEFDDGSPGTVFRNQGNDFRVEARHARWGAWEGVVGFQSEAGRFSADGDEVFAPYSRSTMKSLFVLEEWTAPWGKLSLGGRTEQVSVRSLGNPDPEVSRFVVGERTFNPHSAALGALVNLTPAWQLTSNLAYTERAPKDYELFANGPHLATAAWETGDATLSKEKAASFDVGGQWKSGPHKAQINAYVTRFSNYIGLMPTGNRYATSGELNPVDPSVGSSPEFRYQGLRARFTGLEASGTVRLMGAGGWTPGEGRGSLDLGLRGDVVRAIALDSGEPLPRIAPLRLGATLTWAQGPWSVRGGFDHSAAQSRVPAGSRATKAYTLWNAMVSYRMRAASAQWLWYARLDNITNELAYSASSILTTTAFPKAPLPGRSLRIGVQATF